jgi:hypothetical protein
VSADAPPGRNPNPYAALDAFITQHWLCQPGLDEPHVTETVVVVALGCSCGAKITFRLSPLRGGA